MMFGQVDAPMGFWDFIREFGAEYGLLGVLLISLIAAAFMSLKVTIPMVLQKFEDMNAANNAAQKSLADAFREDVKTLVSDHRSDQKEWRDEAAKRDADWQQEAARRDAEAARREEGFHKTIAEAMKEIKNRP